MVCGVDDAGRGPMMGPLVIAGVCIQKDRLPALRKLGVRDSKQHTARARQALSVRIKDIVDSYHVVCVPPRSIDASVRRHDLNKLEARYMARVISKLDPDTAYVDSCDVDASRFGKNISQMSGGCKIRSHHHADSRFVVVSAASILAKVTRDASISRIARRYREVGSGYPSDSKSVSFLKSHYAEYGTMPSFARKSWMPVQRILRLKRDAL